jgi:hydroxymethylbilane synthase
LSARIRAVFEPSVMLPAAGQGALGIEVRTDRADVVAALAPLVHHTTWLAVAAERAVSRAMGGSCSMPLAAYATLAQDGLTIDAAWGDTEGKLPLVRVRLSGPVSDLASAADLGQRVAADLRSQVLAQGGTLAHLTASADQSA